MAHFRFDKTENWNLDTVTAVNLRPKHVLPGPSKTTSRVLRILATIWDLGSEGHPKQWREPSSCQVLTDASIFFPIIGTRDSRPTFPTFCARAYTHVATCIIIIAHWHTSSFGDSLVLMWGMDLSSLRSLWLSGTHLLRSWWVTPGADTIHFWVRR